MTSNRLYTLLLLSIFFAYAIFLLQPINLVISDLGRHLRNGELVFTNPAVLTTNFYSYTNSSYPFVNHHWGSGLVFYVIQKTFGFAGLSVFFVGTTLVTLFIFLRSIPKQRIITPVLLILVLPVLMSRTEIRPELFSYLFCGTFLFILFRWYNNLITSKWLLLLPLVELLWVNLHIFFMLGPIIIGAFLAEQFFYLILRKKAFNKTRSLYLLYTFLAACTVTLMNPNGVSGAFAPLTIFGNYAYPVFENQSLLFLNEHVDYAPGIYFIIVFFVFIGSWIYALFARKKVRQPISLAFFFVSLLISFLAWTAIRNFALFCFFVIPICAYNLQTISALQPLKKHADKLLFGGFVFTVIVLFSINPHYFLNRSYFKIGLRDGIDKAATFFLKHLKGPVFNNYDIGGYLIYYLYPKEKVFVDNRPEAYPGDFFNNVYIPAQQGSKWHDVETTYNIQTVFFYRNELSIWGRNFLFRLSVDPKWALVYADDYSIIFAKRNGANEAFIQTLNK